jgi:TFIIF-interacting CTD phosphatase-like protein
LAIFNSIFAFVNFVKLPVCTYFQDLDNLNRDLSKVILIDCDPKAFQKHPRNALLLRKWQGTDGDTELIDLAAFLRSKFTSHDENTTLLKLFALIKFCNLYVIFCDI